MFLFHRPCLGSDCVPGSAAAAAFGVLLYSNPHSDACETMVMVAQMSSLPRTWSPGPLTRHLELSRLPPYPQALGTCCKSGGHTFLSLWGLQSRWENMLANVRLCA